jgi:hypothetical protein
MFKNWFLDFVFWLGVIFLVFCCLGKFFSENVEPKLQKNLDKLDSMPDFAPDKEPII